MSLTFETLIAHNKRVSLALMAGMVALLAAVCGFAGLALNPRLDQAEMLRVSGAGACIGGVLTMLGAAVSYFAGGLVVTSITRAQLVEYHDDPLDCRNRAFEHIYIVNPVNRLTRADTDSIWSTHPPVIKRIAMLKRIAGELGLPQEFQGEQQELAPPADAALEYPPGGDNL